MIVIGIIINPNPGIAGAIDRWNWSRVATDEPKLGRLEGESEAGVERGINWKFVNKTVSLWLFRLPESKLEGSSSAQSVRSPPNSLSTSELTPASTSDEGSVVEVLWSSRDSIGA